MTDSPTTDRAPETIAAEALERRVASFEARLFQALLVARAAVPSIILVALLSTALVGRATAATIPIWIALTAWTLVTTPWAWTRLTWARTAPWPLRLEIGVFVALLFVGFGTRQWHLLHAAVPIVFCSLLTRPVVAWSVTGTFVAALVASDVLARLGAPLEQPTGPALPSLLYVAGTGVLLSVRRLLDDLRTLARARRELDGEVHRALAERMRSEARLSIARRATADLAHPLRGIGDLAGELAQAGPAGDRDLEALVRACSAAEKALASLAGAETASEVAPTLANVLEGAGAAGSDLGGSVRMSVPPTLAGVVVPASMSRPLQRVLYEAVTNAVKHGAGPVTVATDAGPPIRFEIANGSARAPRERPGGLGLDAMRADAERIGAQLQIAHASGTTTVTLTTDIPAATPIVPPGDAPFAILLRRRHRTYELAMGIARVLVAIQLTAVVWIAAADAHDLASPLPIVAIALVCWSGAAAMWWRSTPPPRCKTAVAITDAALVLAAIVLLGGVGAPWSGVAMGSAMTLALHASARTGIGFAALAGAAGYPGWELARRTGTIDFLAARVDVPETPVVVGVTIVAVGVAFAGARWAFDRMREAVDAYERVSAEALRARRETAFDEARAEAQRDLHATVRQLVTAAEMRLRILEPTGPDTTAAAGLAARLHEADTVLRRFMAADC